MADSRGHGAVRILKTLTFSDRLIYEKYSSYSYFYVTLSIFM
ncbi:MULTISPECIES: hypothetical protein [unclassified Okeania]|nr:MULTISPECIES: hypothetical protein [unclassified Okeania]